ncbi:Nitronate monooxygenase [Bauldia litoralis]|uniref:Nitronate monooxygenase n=1 Tax=Bauldia litoralis TaxID=665467 RepID=A0A1G6ES07_9HYPH|nr:Nitronate monooxygenase [Bauldia litoralis]
MPAMTSQEMWPDSRLLDLFGVEVPIVQAPMAGPMFSDMVIAVAEAGGRGSLPCATMGTDQLRTEFAAQGTTKPINVNFFCHAPPTFDAGQEAAWRGRLESYYAELGLDPAAPVPRSSRTPFDEEACAVVEELRPEVVSFHYAVRVPVIAAGGIADARGISPRWFWVQRRCRSARLIFSPSRRGSRARTVRRSLVKSPARRP